MTDSTKPHSQADSVPKVAKGANPMRLVILLGVLTLVVGGLAYDRFVAGPGVKAANEKLHESVLKFNEQGLRNAKAGGKEGAAAPEKKSGMLYSQDIQKILGMSPTWTKNEKHYTIECYCWWGWIPLNKNFISVLYVGDPDNRHYSTHYANDMPEENSLPGIQRPAPVDITAKPANANAGVPGAAIPPMAGAPAGGPPGEEKGKGRPQAKSETGDAKEETTQVEEKESAKPEAKKEGESKDGAAPKGESEEKKAPPAEPEKEDPKPAKE